MESGEHHLYERFTDRARKVVQLANQESQRFNHEYIGTEHILLGLVKEGSGVGANVLGNLDVDLRTVRLEVEKLVQSGPENVSMGKLPQTPRAKKVIEYGMEESRNLNHNYVGTEHLLLGLLREMEGVAAQVLMKLGLKLEEVREEVLNILEHDPDARSTREGAAKQRNNRRLPTIGRRDRLVEVAKGYAPFVGQEKPLRELCTALRRGWRNSVLVVGPRGSGRTALVERLAVEISRESAVFPFDYDIYDYDVLLNGKTVDIKLGKSKHR